jgi:hypothetical protein
VVGADVDERSTFDGEIEDPTRERELGEPAVPDRHMAGVGGREA